MQIVRFFYFAVIFVGLQNIFDCMLYYSHTSHLNNSIDDKIIGENHNPMTHLQNINPYEMAQPPQMNNQQIEQIDRVSIPNDVAEELSADRNIGMNNIRSVHRQRIENIDFIHHNPMTHLQNINPYEMDRPPQMNNQQIEQRDRVSIPDDVAEELSADRNIGIRNPPQGDLRSIGFQEGEENEAEDVSTSTLSFLIVNLVWLRLKRHIGMVGDDMPDRHLYECICCLPFVGKTRILSEDRKMMYIVGVSEVESLFLELHTSIDDIFPDCICGYYNACFCSCKPCCDLYCFDYFSLHPGLPEGCYSGVCKFTANLCCVRCECSFFRCLCTFWQHCFR